MNTAAKNRKPKQTIFNSKRVRARVRQNIWSNRYIYLMVIPVIVYFVLLKYMPMWFLRSAFYDYKLLKGFNSKFYAMPQTLETEEYTEYRAELITTGVCVLRDQCVAGQISVDEFFTKYEALKAQGLQDVIDAGTAAYAKLIGG